MYIDSIQLDDLRCFERAKDNVLEFVHPMREFHSKASDTPNENAWGPEPRLKNVSLLLGENGAGKSTVLQALAAVSMKNDAQFFLHNPNFIRSGKSEGEITINRVNIDDQIDKNIIRSNTDTLDILINGSQLRFNFDSSDSQDTSAPLNLKPVVIGGYDVSKYPGISIDELMQLARFPQPIINRFPWGPQNPSYRAYKKYEALESLFTRIFSPDYSALGTDQNGWLTELQSDNPARLEEVLALIRSLLKPFKLSLNEKKTNEDLTIDDIIDLANSPDKSPHRHLSHVYFFIDLLSHIYRSCPDRKSLREHSGVVLVDQIEFNLHPRLHMELTKTLAETFPAIQFIITTNSPLVVGSLEWMNIINLELVPEENRTRVNRIKESVYGLDVEQVLHSPYFGMRSTVVPEKEDALNEIRERIRQGDHDAPLDLIRELGSGMEDQG